MDMFFFILFCKTILLYDIFLKLTGLFLFNLEKLAGSQKSAQAPGLSGYMKKIAYHQ